VGDFSEKCPMSEKCRNILSSAPLKSTGIYTFFTLAITFQSSARGVTNGDRIILEGNIIRNVRASGEVS
jgi:hypothetical protein